MQVFWKYFGKRINGAPLDIFDRLFILKILTKPGRSLIMPFYDLHCGSCDKEFNIMATMAEKTERRIACPICGSTDMSTVYKSAPFFIKSGGRGEVPACAQGNICGASGMGCPHAS